MNLRGKSAWFKSLTNPLHGGGCKIPDDVGVETATVQSVTEISFITKDSTTSPGFISGGVQMFSPYPGISATFASGQNYQYLNTATSSELSIDWDASLAFTTNLPLKTYSQGVRPVSAGLYIESEASLSNASGDMTLFVTPWSFYEPGIPFSSYSNNFGTSIMPLNQNTAMRCTMYPVNEENCDYGAFYEPEVQTSTIGKGDGEQRPWGLGCIVTGCPAGVKFRGRIVVNYEFIPRENSVDLLSASVGPIDIAEQQYVEAEIAKVPSSQPIPAQVMSSSPSAVEEVPDNTGLGFLGKMIESVIEVGVPTLVEGLL